MILNEKEMMLREILIKYSHGDKKDKEQILRDIVINKTIDLDDYKDVVTRNGYNKTYLRLYKELKAQAVEYFRKHEEEIFRQYEEEKAAKKIIRDLMYSLKSSYNPDNYKLFYCNLKTITELKEQISFYLKNEKVSSKTKSILSDINKDIIKILTNYEKNKEKPKEIELKKIIELYNSGEKETVFKELLQNETKYQKNYTLQSRNLISIITRNEINELLEECKQLKEKMQEDYALEAICYLYDIDKNVEGQFKKEYFEVYEAYLSKYDFKEKLEKLSIEKQTKITNIINDIKLAKRKEYELEKRGYGKEDLECIKHLVEKFKQNKPISYSTVNKIKYGNTRIPTWDISTYILKFKNDNMLSEDNYEIYKKFAKEHGYKILSWILLENCINDSKDENSISLEEINNYCQPKHRTVNRPVEEEIRNLKYKIKEDKSLTDEEKEEIVRKIQLFIKKYEQAVANKVLESNSINKDTYNTIVNEILDPNYIVTFDNDKNKKYIEVFTSIYEVTRNESVKEVLKKLIETEKMIQKDINIRKRDEIYVAIIKNFQKIADLIISGVSYGNGKKRPFDMIDYYQITSLKPDVIEGIGKEKLSAEQWTAWQRFKPKTEDNEFIGEKRLKAIMESKVEYGAKIENNKVIQGTGKILSDEEKTAILNYLKSKKVPFTVRNYLIAQKRYTTGIIEQELLDSQNNNSDDKKVNKKNS